MLYLGMNVSNKWNLHFALIILKDQFPAAKHCGNRGVINIQSRKIQVIHTSISHNAVIFRVVSQLTSAFVAFSG